MNLLRSLKKFLLRNGENKMEQNLHEDREFNRRVDETPKGPPIQFKTFKIVYEVDGMQSEDTTEAVSAEEIVKQYTSIPKIKILGIKEIGQNPQMEAPKLSNSSPVTQPVSPTTVSTTIPREYQIDGMYFRVNEFGKLQRKGWVQLPDSVLAEFGEMNKNEKIIPLTKKIYKFSWVDVEETKG